MRQTAVVICPGRGTYTKTELGYLKRYHKGKRDSVTRRLDAALAQAGHPTVSSLDGADAFSLKTHTPGEYASTLIYACSAADFLAIDRERFEIVAVTGNSMGWYSALALAGALAPDADFTLIHTMGSMMRGGTIGGQLIYPLVDADWRLSAARDELITNALAEVRKKGHQAHVSIKFGGYLIVGGDQPALQAFMRLLPPVEDGKYPFILVNHAAFHTPLLTDVSQQAFATLSVELFQKPELPMVDGRGCIWQPYSTDLAELRRYTLGHQVVETYDFTRAIDVVLKEFSPDKLILLGPGATSGGAIGQILVSSQWLGLKSKSDFSALQAENPFLIAMGREDQASLVGRK